MPVQKIIHAGTIIGYKITRPARGSRPVTSATDALQVLTVCHPAGHVIAPHLHTRSKRVQYEMHKALVVLAGKIRLDLYGPDKKKIRAVTLTSGQAFVLVGGGWGVQFIQTSQVLEFKNGPFLRNRIVI